MAEAQLLKTQPRLSEARAGDLWSSPCPYLGQPDRRPHHLSCTVRAPGKTLRDLRGASASRLPRRCHCAAQGGGKGEGQSELRRGCRSPVLPAVHATETSSSLWQDSPVENLLLRAKGWQQFEALQRSAHRLWLGAAGGQRLFQGSTSSFACMQHLLAGRCGFSRLLRKPACFE